jgi:hypothetical protein
MASLITKIGADSSQLRQDVGELPNVVKKSFDKMKDASSGGLEDNVKGLKRGFNDLKDLFLGAGIVEGVKKFYDVAIEAANKSTDANDMNAAAVRRFGASLNEGKEVVGKFAMVTVGTFNQIGEQIGSGLKGIGALITGTFDKWGEGERVLDATDKAARAAELSLSEAKKHADDFKKITEEIKTLTEAREQAERKALPIAEQKNILQQKLLEAQRAEVEAGDNMLERRKAQVEQLKAGNALLEVQKTINDEQQKQDEKRRSEAEALNNAKINALTIQEKIAKLTQEVADSEALINSNAMTAAGKEQERVVLAERRKNLQEAQNKALEQENKYYEDLVKLGDDWAKFHGEVLTANTKLNIQLREEKEIRTALARTEEGTPERIKAENRLLENQKAIREANKDVASADKEIAALLLKGRENLTEVEKLRLSILTGQAKQADLDKELHVLTTKSLTGELIPAEKERLAILIGQTNEAEKQKKLASDTLSLVQARVSVEQTSTGDTYGSMSTTALQGTLSRLKSKLADEMAADTSQGFHVGGAFRSPAIAQYQNDISKIEREISQRSEVSNYARRFGEAATIRQYGDTLAEKALSDVRDTSTRTANSIETIADTLTQSGIFRK